MEAVLSTSEGTTRGIDIMLIVVEPGARSIETAGRIVELARQIDIQKFGRSSIKQGKMHQISKISLSLWYRVSGVIPYDTTLFRLTWKAWPY